jgi:hypothetical protein
MTQIQRTPNDLEFAALVGLDWADQKHDICLLDLRTSLQEQTVLKHSPEAIDDWAPELRRRFHGRPIGICLKQSRGALVYALMLVE